MKDKSMEVAPPLPLEIWERIMRRLSSSEIGRLLLLVLPSLPREMVKKVPGPCGMSVIPFFPALTRVQGPLIVSCLNDLELLKPWVQERCGPFLHIQITSSLYQAIVRGSCRNFGSYYPFILPLLWITIALLQKWGARSDLLITTEKTPDSKTTVGVSYFREALALSLPTEDDDKGTIQGTVQKVIDSAPRSFVTGLRFTRGLVKRKPIPPSS